MSNSQLNDGKSEFEFIERINKYLFNEKMKVKKKIKIPLQHQQLNKIALNFKQLSISIIPLFI